MLKVILFYFLFFCLENTISGVLHYASTDVGSIIGKLEKTYFQNKTYQYVTYLGVPYADESFDFWRFRKPRVPRRFEQPYNATYIRPSCLQIGYGRTRQKTSENCLYLNIYAPAESTINPRKRFPVLVYFHGGDFKVGSANDVSPEVLSSYGNIVLVTVNYRLGIFGFLSTGDDLARGNFGLWDQHFAIKWIRYNIASFGGDTDSITLLGQTAGAASALYQGLYPGNRGLFQRIIAINGNSLNPWAINLPNAKLIGHKLGCTQPDEYGVIDNVTMIDCIKDTTSDQLLRVGAEVQNLGPTVDGEFLTHQPAMLLNPGMLNNTEAHDFFRSLDIIIGFTDNNGDILLEELFASQLNESDLQNVSITRSEFKYTFIPELLQPLFDTHRAINDQEVSFVFTSHVKHVVIHQYTNWTDPNSSDFMMKSLRNISTELNYFIPTIQVADYHHGSNRNASTYMFKFDYTPQYDVWDSPWISRVGSGVETLFIFGLPTRMTQALKLQRKDVTPWDILLAENMMKWISNFVKTGNPNKPLPLLGNTSTPAWNFTTGTWSKRPFEKEPVTWPRYDDRRTFFTFSTNMTSRSIGHLPGEPQTSFWLILIPALLQDTTIRGYGVVPLGVPEELEPLLTGIDLPSTVSARGVIFGLVAIAGGLLISIVAIVCYVCKVFC